MEWMLAVLCAAPAAAADVKYRSVSLESCAAALLVGGAVLVAWAVSAPPADAARALIVTAAVSGAAWAGGRAGGGDGDWWFVAGACAALSTLDVFAPLLAVAFASGAMLACHVAMCATRPGLPFPRRLYEHVKREGDAFRLEPSSGRLADAGESGMVVRPALPMVAFVVAGAGAAGALAAAA